MKVKILFALFIALMVAVVPVSCGYFDKLDEGMRTVLFKLLSEEIDNPNYDVVNALRGKFNEHEYTTHAFIDSRFWYNIFTHNDANSDEYVNEQIIYTPKIVMRLLMLIGLNGVFYSRKANHALIRAQLGPNAQVAQFKNYEATNPTATVLSSRLTTFFVFSEFEAGKNPENSPHNMLKKPQQSISGVNFRKIEGPDVHMTYLDLLNIDNRNSVIDTSSLLAKEHYEKEQKSNGFVNRELFFGPLFKFDSGKIEFFKFAYQIEIDSDIQQIVDLAAQKSKDNSQQIPSNLHDIIAVKLGYVDGRTNESTLGKFAYFNGLNSYEPIFDVDSTGSSVSSGEGCLAVRVEQKQETLRLIFDIAEEIAKALQKKDEKNEKHIQLRKSFFNLMISDSNGTRRDHTLKLIDSYIEYTEKLTDIKVEIKDVIEKGKAFLAEEKKQTKPKDNTPALLYSMPHIRIGGKYTSLDIASRQFCGFKNPPNGGIFDYCNKAVDIIMHIQHEILRLVSNEDISYELESPKLGRESIPFSNTFLFKFAENNNIKFTDEGNLYRTFTGHFKVKKDSAKIEKVLKGLFTKLRTELDEIVGYINTNDLTYNAQYFYDMVVYAQLYALKLFSDRYGANVTTFEELVEKTKPKK